MTEGKTTILVVDDEELVRNLLQRILEGAGYTVHTAADGREALAKISGLEIAAVLLDIKMPEISGMEVLQRIANDRPETSVIMTTAVSDTQTAIEAMKLGADDYIIKPFNHDDLVLRVRKAIEKRNLKLDITERKQAEQERERLVQKLEATVKELEAFAYTISHDLRAPLHTIRSFVNSLLEDLERRQRERVVEDVGAIRSGVDRMEHLLKGILQYSRSGTPIQPSENVPFGGIVRETLEQLASQISSVGATIAAADDFPTVYADPMRIGEVLTTLIQNSIDYRDSGRPLTIEIGHRRSDGEVIFFVRDNGIGIDPTKADKIFELFYRGDSKSVGIGAGLAIAKRIVEAHGGRIWVESDKGKGATMCFTLPGRAEILDKSQLRKYTERRGSGVGLW